VALDLDKGERQIAPPAGPEDGVGGNDAGRAGTRYIKSLRKAKWPGDG